MSGHSKWHNIQGKKGKADAARSNQFTKIARLIMVAAREGGADPATNFSLRLAVEKAKAVNMPKDNIERAIKKGTGELHDGTHMEAALYEGFGPGGVAFMVEAITDNKTRTVSDIKNIFTKHGGSVGAPGSVNWQFTRVGVVRLGETQNAKLKTQKSEIELAMIEAGAEDILESEYGLEIRSSLENFQKIMEKLQALGLEPEESGLEWVAKDTMAVADGDRESVQRLYDTLDENDDVRGVYTNAS